MADREGRRAPGDPGRGPEPRVDASSWDAFVAASQAPSYLQLSRWAEAKRANGWRPACLLGPATSQGQVGMQVLVRTVGPIASGFGYAPRGPMTDRWTTATPALAADLLRSARPRLRGVGFVRVDPEVEAGAGCDEDGALRGAFLARGWREAPSVQPVATRVIDLHADEDALWGDLRGKWRQYVSLARRRGVVVVEADRSRLPEFHAIMLATGGRTGSAVRTLASYQAAWDALAPTGGARLLFAHDDEGRPVSTLFLARVADRVSEPYGGMTADGAALRAAYLLKWEGIRSSREAGATSYDMWGLVNEGIDFFKAGFGGREVRYVGGFELEIDHLAGARWRAITRLRRMGVAAG